MICCIADNLDLPILPKCVSPIAIIHFFNSTFHILSFKKTAICGQNEGLARPAKQLPIWIVQLF